MKALGVLLIAFAAVAFCGAQTINFDSAVVGSTPAGWTVAMTHKGGAPRWEVLKDDSAPSQPNVFAQVSTDATGGRFPLAVYDKATLKDGSLSVKFKAISGAADQAAGLVWRYRDPDNYYIVRANALEGNVVLYKVEKGQRTDLPLVGKGRTYGMKERVPSGEWGTLRVVANGDLFEVYHNDKKLYEVKDETFNKAGKVG